MDRETTIIETPNGHKVELKTYITGREKRYIESAFFRDIEMTQTGGEQSIKGLKGAAIEEAQNKTIETVVVALDGAGNDILNRVLDFPQEDFDTVIAAINDITASKKKAQN